MEEKKSNRHLTRLLLLLALFCAAAAFALYFTSGTNKLSPDLNRNCLIAFGVSSGLCLLNLLWEVIRDQLSNLLAYGQYLAALWGFAEYIVSQLNYIAHVFYGVDGNSFTPVMIATAAVGLSAFLLALIAAIRLRRAAYRRNLAETKEV